MPQQPRARSRAAASTAVSTRQIVTRSGTSRVSPARASSNPEGTAPAGSGSLRGKHIKVAREGTRVFPRTEVMQGEPKQYYVIVKKPATCRSTIS